MLACADTNRLGDEPAVYTPAARKYVTIVKAYFANLRQFTLNFFSSLITLPVSLIILVYVFRSVISGGDTLGTYSVVQISLYFVGTAITWQVVQPAAIALWESWQDINTGNLAIYLTRPVDYIWLRYARSFASMLVYLVPAVFVMLALQVVQMRVNPMAVLQYMVALWLAFSTLFMWWFLAGALSFWWERPFTFRDLSWNLITLFSGGLIPVDLLPPTLRTLAEFLPFRGIYYIPSSIFAGTLSGPIGWKDLGTQCAWLMGLTLLTRVVWAAGVKTYDGRGG